MVVAAAGVGVIPPYELAKIALPCAVAITAVGADRFYCPGSSRHAWQCRAERLSADERVALVRAGAVLEYMVNGWTGWDASRDDGPWEVVCPYRT